MAGTRPGGAIAAAWAIMNYLGEEGYLALADGVMKTTAKLKDGIRAIPELRILGEPVMSIMAIASDRLNAFEIGDEMGLRGWSLDRQQFPSSLHMTVTPAHAPVADQFLADLHDAGEPVKKPSRARLFNSLQVGLVQAAARVLPPGLMSRLTRRSSGTGGQSLGVGGRSAAMYGMMATLPNRGDLTEVVLDILDQFTTPQQ
jgi:hypothetical protein